MLMIADPRVLQAYCAYVCAADPTWRHALMDFAFDPADPIDHEPRSPDQLPQLVDARFTAEMERDLDTMAQGALKRTAYLDRVWREALQPAIAKAQRTAPRLRVPGQEAVFEVQGGQVSLRTAQGAVVLPSELLPEDLNEQSIAALLAGTWKAGKAARVEGTPEASSSSQPARASRRKKASVSGGGTTARQPRQKRTTSTRQRKA